jgi:hypothetical protein
MFLWGCAAQGFGVNILREAFYIYKKYSLKNCG